MKVGKLTIKQKNQIAGQLYADDSYFNPIQDANAKWVISTQEMDECVVEEFMWVKELPLIDYEPKPAPPNRVVLHR
jgi:hypothetical protein